MMKEFPFPRVIMNLKINQSTSMNFIVKNTLINGIRNDDLIRNYNKFIKNTNLEQKISYITQ